MLIQKGNLCRASALLLIAPLLLIAAPAFADESSELPDASIEVTLAFASNNIDRGEDLHANRARQRNRAYGAHTGAWAFQPNITLHAPEDLASGFYYDFWGSLPLYGRGDRDLDGFFQAGPDQPDWNTLTPAEQAASLADGTTPPGFYSEEVGLAREDRVIQTFGYEAAETRVGRIGFGLAVDAIANVKGKGLPTTTEIYISYSLPMLSQLGFEAYAATTAPEFYYSIGWSDSLALAEHQSFDYELIVGYGSYARARGVQDVTLALQYNLYGFFVGAIASHRPTLAIFDEDEDAALDSPEWLRGASNRGDGLVADPSRQNGVYNQIVNRALQDFLQSTSDLSSYSYTPRQKLPRVVWAVLLGYAFEI